MDQWFAIRVTYSRELIVQAYLNGLGIDSYVPMHRAEQTRGGRRYEREVPLIHNLLFVHTSAENLREIKAHTLLPIRYMMDRELKTPIVIPDEQMRNFIAVVQTFDRDVELVDTASLHLSEGDRVRVRDGVFKGVEGIFLRSARGGRVAVELHGIATALTATIPMRQIEMIMVNEEL